MSLLSNLIASHEINPVKKTTSGVKNYILAKTQVYWNDDRWHKPTQTVKFYFETTAAYFQATSSNTYVEYWISTLDKDGGFTKITDSQLNNKKSIYLGTASDIPIDKKFSLYSRIKYSSNWQDLTTSDTGNKQSEFQDFNLDTFKFNENSITGLVYVDKTHTNKTQYTVSLKGKTETKYCYPSDNGIKFPDVSKTGYTLTWYSENSGKSYAPGYRRDVKPATNTVYNFTLKQSKKSYNNTFNLNSGTRQDGTKTNYTVSTAYQNKIATPSENPKRTGYTFAGWFTAASGGSKVDGTTQGDSAKTYYAHWTANTYTNTLKYTTSHGNTPNNQTESTTYPNTQSKFTINATDLTDSTYIFVGWSYNNTIYTKGDTIYVNSNSATSGATVTLTAIWRSAEEVQVDYGGGKNLISGKTGITHLKNSISLNASVLDLLEPLWEIVKPGHIIKGIYCYYSDGRSGEIWDLTIPISKNNLYKIEIMWEPAPNRIYIKTSDTQWTMCHNFINYNNELIEI